MDPKLAVSDPDLAKYSGSSRTQTRLNNWFMGPKKIGFQLFCMTNLFCVLNRHRAVKKGFNASKTQQHTKTLTKHFL
jgi:hypothetical protein